MSRNVVSTCFNMFQHTQNSKGWLVWTCLNGELLGVTTSRGHHGYGFPRPRPSQIRWITWRDLQIHQFWWCNNHLEKYEFVNGKYYPIYEMDNSKNIWNHQAEFLFFPQEVLNIARFEHVWACLNPRAISLICLSQVLVLCKFSLVAPR